MQRKIDEEYIVLKQNGYLARKAKESGILTAPYWGSNLVKRLLSYRFGCYEDFSVRKYKDYLDISSYVTSTKDIVKVLKELHIEGYIRKINGLYVTEIVL